MATEYKLEVQKRNDLGKKASKQIRKNGLIPGIYYSSDSKESISFSIEQAELRNASKSGARLYSVNVGGKARTVLFKNVQYHPVTEEVLHIDLYGVKMDEKIQIKVPLILLGDPVGVTQEGGNLMQSVLEIDIVCLPAQIPEKIELNIEELHIGESIHAGSVNLPENIDLGMAEETVVASVNYEMKEEELETAISEEDDVTFDEESDGDQSSEDLVDDGDKSNSDSE
tara:strand:- start:8 stop:688 length:681 start_codon:yes stop_codon:yes gene_type:complete